MSQQTPNSTLLRICSEEVVAYLKVLEVCASFVLTEREELITKENELRLRNNQHPGLEIFSKLFGGTDNNNTKNPKKQLTFNKTIEIIKRQSSSSNNNNNNNSTTNNDVAFRVYSQEERHRMSSQAIAASDDHNNSNNDNLLSLSNKIVLETLYDHLLNAARRKILKCLPQLKPSSNNNNDNDDYSSQVSTAVDVSLWPPCDDIEDTLVLNKQLDDRTAMSVSEFLANSGGNSSALVSSTPDANTNNNNNNSQPSCEILLYGILRKVVENIILLPYGNSNSLKNKNVISLSEALFIHRLECDAPGVYECTVARDTVHTIARRRARELNNVTTTTSTTTMMMMTNQNSNNDANQLLQENLKSLNQGDRSAAGFAYRNYLKTKGNENDDDVDNNDKNKKQQNQQDVEIPVTNTTIEYQVLPARTVDVISVNSRADGGILVQPWSLEKENYSSNQALNVALRRTFFSFLMSKQLQQQNQRNQTAIGALQKNLQNAVATSILPPLASLENLMKICVGSSVSNVVSTLLGNNNNNNNNGNQHHQHGQDVFSSTASSSKKVYVRYGVNVSVANIPEVYIFVPKSALTLKSKLAAFGGAGQQQQDDHRRKILNHSTIEESKFSKFLLRNSRGNNHILFDNLQQHLRFSSKFGLDVNQAASNLKVRFFYPGFFLRDEFQQEQKQENNNINNSSTRHDDAAASSNKMVAASNISSSTTTTTTKLGKKNTKNQDIDEIDASLIKEKYNFKSALSRENISLPPIEHMTVFDDTTTHYNNLIFRNNNNTSTNNNNEVLEKKKELLGKLRELLFCEENKNSDDNNTFEILDFAENNHDGAFLKDPTATVSQKKKKSKIQTDDDSLLVADEDDDDDDEAGEKRENFSVVRVIKVKNSPENFNFASLVFSMFVLHGHRTSGGFASSSSNADEDNNMLRNNNNSENENEDNVFFSQNKQQSQNSMTSLGGDQAYRQELKLKDDQLFLQNFFQKHHSIKEEQKKQHQQEVAQSNNNNSAVTRTNNPAVGNGGAAIFKREDADVERILIRCLSAQQNMKLSELMSTVNAGVGPNNANSVPQMQMNRVLKKIAQFDASAGGYKLK